MQKIKLTKTKKSTSSEAPQMILNEGAYKATDDCHAHHAVCTDSPPQQRILLSVRQFADRHPAFPEGSLRYLIFQAESRNTSKGTIGGNGLNVALVRIGRKLLIDESKFFHWVDAQGTK